MRPWAGRCSHKTLNDHSVKLEHGPRIWRCSACGNRGAWGPTWSYLGNIECGNCWMAQIDQVACSPKCAASFAPPPKEKRDRATEAAHRQLAKKLTKRPRTRRREAIAALGTDE